MAEARCNSYYNATIKQETAYPSLRGDLSVDIAVVGGGFSGVNTALELAERGFKVAILEANKLAWGATGRNGGQVTGSLSGDAAMTKALRKHLGADAEDYIWRMRWRGHDIIKSRVEKYDIDCDLKYGHLHAAYQPSHMNELQAMHDEGHARGMGQYMTLLSREDVPDYLGTTLYHGALLNTKNMHLHSVNLCIGEARAAESLGTQIFENTRVSAIRHGARPQVITEHGVVTADKVILAGNAYHRLERRKLRGKLFPASLGNMATEPLTEAQVESVNPRDLAVYDCRFVLDYYRLTADKRLMFGGGTNYSGKDAKSVSGELLPAMLRVFPQLAGVKIEFEWTGMAGIVINRIPQLGKTSDNVYYLQGYSGHGIATSHIMSEILANAVAGEMTECDYFASMFQWRIPLPEWFGNQALALGMQWYKLAERWR
ncbi:MAG: FAD-binding oxidoreductase [Halieaceae bacterium]|jgi:glycine/D-amino acid oxidase-like deaminating enzyme|nr:FAD-binding oxidoreductase [Halieaceae bacterium]